MKIICVGRNYVDHAKELNNEIPEEPVLFIKPDTALLPKKHPFVIPDFTDDLHYEAELVVKINRLGKNIDEQFAHKYYSEIGFGIDFTARDLQSKLKAKGLPWEKAKAFDFSSPLSERFIPVTQKQIEKGINFSLLKNGKTVQTGNTNDMLFGINKLIAEISKYFTLKIGDLIYTGTPAGVGKTERNDAFEGYIEDEKMFQLSVF